MFYRTLSRRYERALAWTTLLGLGASLATSYEVHDTWRVVFEALAMGVALVVLVGSEGEPTTPGQTAPREASGYRDQAPGDDKTSNPPPCHLAMPGASMADLYYRQGHCPVCDALPPVHGGER
jgi:hypothetical protein